MEDPQDFKAIHGKITTTLINATRSSNAIGAEDLSFQRAANPTTGDELDELESRTRQLASELLESNAKGSGTTPPTLDDDEIDLQWSSIVDVIDSVLERADTVIDEYTGLIKRKNAPNPEPAPMPKKQKQPGLLDRNLRHANIVKPQKFFDQPINNFDQGPWKPILTNKPWAIYPLEQSLELFKDKDGHEQYRHPYENEIIQLYYPKTTYETAEPIPYLPVETTSAIWVDTMQGVYEMLEELKQADVIAVDLEHHDTRTFTGLLSLMQISTREKDWIVDTLKPWRHKLQILNQVFTDRRKVKVLHGAQSDIIWLQRDLGLYIVGLFDTYFACDALNHQSRGLAGLLQRYVGFEADKKYQMADWRIRPLPDEMFYYARADTHYLLYIFDKVRNELVEVQKAGLPDQKCMSWVLAESKKVSLLRHEGYPYDSQNGHGPRGWFGPVSRGQVFLDGEQFAIYRAVHQWRDSLARRHDESPVYIMNQHTLMQIARIKPPDRKALASLLDPKNRVLKNELDELFGIITTAKARGSLEPSLTEYMQQLYTGNAQAEAHPHTSTIRGGDGAAGLLELDSQLWGKMKLSSLHETSKEGNNRPMSLPWSHQLPAADTQAGSPTALVERPKSRESLPQQPEAVEASEDEEFILKKGKTKKISHASRGEEVATSDEMDVDSTSSIEDDEAAAAKKLEKKQRKEAKRLKKEAKKAKELAAMGNENADQEEEEAFDYANADSVLHAKRTGGVAASGSGKKNFDPYAIGDGPKAARRMHHEKTGKTATFKK